MRINVPNLQDVIKKATLNYSIETVQLKIDSERIISKMRSSNNNVVVVLNLPNDVLSDVTGIVDINFDNPNVKVKPYLNLIDNEICEAVVSDEKINLKDGKHKTNLHFCMPSFVTTFNQSEPPIVPFYEIHITKEILAIFKKILSVGSTFDKVYFTVRGGQLIIETTDRLNRFANGISFVIGSVDQPDLDICIEYKNFVGVFQCIKGDISVDEGETAGFKSKLVWRAEQRAGMVIFEKSDATERYYLMSKLESN
jgi:hypothetical protein